MKLLLVLPILAALQVAVESQSAVNLCPNVICPANTTCRTSGNGPYCSASAVPPKKARDPCRYLNVCKGGKICRVVLKNGRTRRSCLAQAKSQSLQSAGACPKPELDVLRVVNGTHQVFTCGVTVTCPRGSYCSSSSPSLPPSCCWAGAGQRVAKKPKNPNPCRRGKRCRRGQLCRIQNRNGRPTRTCIDRITALRMNSVAGACARKGEQIIHRQNRNWQALACTTTNTTITITNSNSSNSNNSNKPCPCFAQCSPVSSTCCWSGLAMKQNCKKISKNPCEKKNCRSRDCRAVIIRGKLRATCVGSRRSRIFDPPGACQKGRPALKPAGRRNYVRYAMCSSRRKCPRPLVCGPHSICCLP